MRIAVLGLGNVLQGDDGAGATVVQRLAARYRFEPEIRLEDLGTPGLHLHPLLADLDAVILVDTVLAEDAPGTVRCYRSEDLTRQGASPRMSPHDPGLIETLERLELLDSAPEELCVVGVVPEKCDAGVELSAVVEAALPEAERKVVDELERLGVRTSKRRPPATANLWWRSVSESRS